MWILKLKCKPSVKGKASSVKYLRKEIFLLFERSRELLCLSRRIKYNPHINSYCTFYIVRHAQPEANIHHIISGQTNPHLSEVGKNQSIERGKSLKDINFDAAFSSDLYRAKETAELIVAERKLALTATKILRERNYGAVEGKSFDQLGKELQKRMNVYNAMEYKDRHSVKFVPDMESDEEVVGRFITFLRETALAYPGKTVLVVTHGNMMRTLLAHLGFGSIQELSHGAAKNTGYYVLKSDGVEFEIVKTVGIEKKQV